MAASMRKDISSRPIADNAIYRLVRAVDRVSHYDFPVQLNDANRGYFSGMASLVGGADGAAMAAIVRDPHDAAALAVLDKEPNWHAMLRTTCVATMLSAGHATNALPQRATANINCHIFPGVSRVAILEQLQRIADDPAVKISVTGNPGPLPPRIPLTAQILDPVKKVAAQLWPGVPVVPALEPGGSDAVYLDRAGIPTYGITGIFTDPDGGHIHGLNERVRVQSVEEGRMFLYRLVKLYADQ